MRATRRESADEVARREASLADARREFAAGELAAEDLAASEGRERAALAELALRRAAMAPPAEPPAPRSRRVRRKRWLVLGAAALAAALAVVLWSAVVPRQAGTSITGSLSLGRAQRITQLLTEAQADVATANDVAALAAYQQVLALDRTNVVALTQSGWLDFSAGSAGHDAALVTLGVGTLRRAIGLAPRDAAPRLYYAIAASATPGNRALARAQFVDFLALHPSPAQLAVARPYLSALGLRG